MTAPPVETLRDPNTGLVGVFGRGLAMGVAEAVPGVSGGTIAFVSGIYDELVRSLARFSHRSLPLLLREGWRTFAERHNLTFFVALGSGMAASFFIVALVINELLETHGTHLSGLFFGLILGSVLHIGLQSPKRWLASAGVAGLAIGLAMGFLFGGQETGAFDQPGQTGLAGLIVLFGAGAIAATAWILPGISGAFVLLLLGLYKPMLAALAGGEIVVIAVFAAGLATGVLLFSKLLGWLLRAARGPVVALLTGVMAGSLTLLWPWPAAMPDWNQPSTLGVVAMMACGVAVAGLLAFAARRRAR